MLMAKPKKIFFTVMLILFFAKNLFAIEPAGTVIEVIPILVSSEKLELNKIDERFTKSSKIYMRKGQAAIPISDPFFESCVSRFYLGTFRFEDTDYSGQLITGNALFNAGLGISCDNYFPYIHVKYEYASVFDVFINDTDQTNHNHRYTGSFQGYEIAGGIRFVDAPLIGSFRFFVGQMSTKFTFRLGSQDLNLITTFGGIGIEF